MQRQLTTCTEDTDGNDYRRMQEMIAFRESKTAAKLDGTYKEKIFSFNTYQTYWKQVKVFLKWVRHHHPECTTIKSCRKLVNPYPESRAAEGLSAWSLSTMCAALCKLYKICTG